MHGIFFPSAASMSAPCAFPKAPINVSCIPGIRHFGQKMLPSRTCHAFQLCATTALHAGTFENHAGSWWEKHGMDTLKAAPDTTLLPDCSSKHPKGEFRTFGVQIGAGISIKSKPETLQTMLHLVDCVCWRVLLPVHALHPV